MVIPQKLHAKPVVYDMQTIERNSSHTHKQCRNHPSLRNIHPKIFHIIADSEIDNRHERDIDVPNHWNGLCRIGWFSADDMHGEDAFKMGNYIENAKDNELLRSIEIFREP